MATNCTICGSRFGNITCGYCTNSVCSSCLVQDKTKCIKCSRVRKPPYKFLKRNLPFILLFAALWFFTSGFYPFPFYLAVGKHIDMTIMQPILIATTLMAIPFVFLMVAWKKKPPTSTSGRWWMIKHTLNLCLFKASNNRCNYKSE